MYLQTIYFITQNVLHISKAIIRHRYKRWYRIDNTGNVRKTWQCSAFVQ